MPTKWLKFNKIKERGIIDSHPTLKRRIEHDGFPPGKWFGPNDRRFPEDEVEAWLASRPSVREHELPGTIASQSSTACRKRRKTIRRLKREQQATAAA